MPIGTQISPDSGKVTQPAAMEAPFPSEGNAACLFLKSSTLESCDEVKWKDLASAFVISTVRVWNAPQAPVLNAWCPAEVCLGYGVFRRWGLAGRSISPGVRLCLALSACFQANITWTVLVLFPSRVTLTAMPSAPGWTRISFFSFQMFLLGVLSMERKLLMQCSLLSKISPSYCLSYFLSDLVISFIISYDKQVTDGESFSLQYLIF